MADELSQIVNFLNRIPNFDNYNAAILDLFLPSHRSICFTVVFTPLTNFFLYNNSMFMVKFVPGSNRFQIIIQSAKQAYVSNTRASDTSQKLGSRNFGRIADSVVSKAKFAISPLLGLPGL